MAVGSRFDTNVKHVQTPLRFPDLTAVPDPPAVVLYSLTGFFSPAASAPAYLQLYDRGQPPVNGTVARKSFRLSPGSNFSVVLDGPPGDKGSLFEIGCWIAMSDAEEVYTPLALSSDYAVLSGVGRAVE